MVLVLVGFGGANDDGGTAAAVLASLKVCHFYSPESGKHGSRVAAVWPDDYV